MSNNVSPKPSDSGWRQGYRIRPRWQRWGIELLLAFLVVTLLSQWLSRHLLDRNTPLPALTLTRLDGLPVRFPDATQAPKTTLVYLFAPWCSVCRVSMPALKWLDSDDIRIIAIALDWRNKSEVANMVQSVHYAGTTLLGDAETARQLNIRGYPSYYVIDQHGNIRFADQGLSTLPGLWLRTRLANQE
ncbi:TlpA family protein disulfide reductase [Oceanobacter antarcticus]|jgi:thiol-disulfide isomerase/thioredoxin|uniref:Redoxin family protein n=1 Tax=Oceanobacter antarcticus TaxID=3133425 RepID=A0ABW8NH38_9GAMM